MILPLLFLSLEGHLAPLRLLGQWHVREVADGVQPGRRVSLERREQRCEVVLRQAFHGDELERLAQRALRRQAGDQDLRELTATDHPVARIAGYLPTIF